MRAQLTVQTVARTWCSSGVLLHGSTALASKATVLNANAEDCLGVSLTHTMTHCCFQIANRPRGGVPRRPVMPQPGGRAAALHRRHGMVRQVLHEHATSYQPQVMQTEAVA